MSSVPEGVDPSAAIATVDALPNRRPSLRRYALLGARQAFQNRKYARAHRRFLVVQDPIKPYSYSSYMQWLALYFPSIRARLELHTLPCLVRDWSRFSLHIPWLQDPVQMWSQRAYRWANRVAARCDEHGIPIVNRVDRLTNTGKAEGARLISKAGLRTPRMALITDADEFRDTRLGLPLPLFVREDWGHGGELARADTEADVKALPLEEFNRPVATELIDLPAADGLYRKYRYVVADDIGARYSIIFSHQWAARTETRAIVTDDMLEEEREFVEEVEPNHSRFVAAREALGLQFAAFDYGWDRNGELIVWEANPYPYFYFIPRKRYNVWRPTTRIYAAMTRLYLKLADMKIPEPLTGILERQPLA